MNRVFKPLLLSFSLIAFSQAIAASTLSDIYELALKNDPRLKSAEATYRANLETEKQALASLLPKINAKGEYSEKDSEDSSSRILEQKNALVPAASDDDGDSDSTTYSLSLEQTLFDLSAWFSFKQGKQITKQAEAQFAYDQQDLIIRTAEAYFDVLRARDNLEASRAEERATKRQLEQTQQRFDVGLIAITDVHEARASYDLTVAQRLNDEGRLGTAYESLSVLTGQSHENLWQLTSDYPVINPEPLSRDEWVQFALKNNYQLQAAQYATEAARQNANAKKMGHAPTLTGSYRYSDFDEDGINISNVNNAEKPFETKSESETFGIQLNIPIFSGGRVSAQRRQAYEQYNAALQQSIEQQRTVLRDTRAQHITVTTDVQRVKARQQANVSTRSALEATQAGYEVGTRNIVDVLQAQRSLYASLRDYANARYDYVINMLKLKQAAGMLSPQDIYGINKWLVVPPAATATDYESNISETP